jgi:hypothetical protein
MPPLFLSFREATNGAVTNTNAHTQPVNQPEVGSDTKQTSFLGSFSHACRDGHNQQRTQPQTLF